MRTEDGVRFRIYRIGSLEIRTTQVLVFWFFLF